MKASTSQTPMCIRAAVSSQLTGTARLNTVTAEVHGKTCRLWWRFEQGAAVSAPSTSNHAAVALLPLAMNQGVNLHVEGVLDRSLVENLEELVEAWSLWRPDLFRRIRISADEMSDRLPVTSPHAALMFSGGVDATFALIANQTGLLGSRSTAVKYGLLVQGFDIPLDRADWYREALAHAGAMLRAFGAAPLEVSTNWREFGVNWEMGFGFGVTAVLHQMDGTCGKGLWASDEPYNHEVIPWGSNSIANPLLSGSAYPVRAVGAGFDRTEKVACIAPHSVVREHLRVCWRYPDNGQNCGVCEKCVRTRLNFLATGHQDVPAFAGQLLPEQVRHLRIDNAAQRDMLVQILDQHGHRLPTEIRAALKERIAHGKMRGKTWGNRMRSWFRR